MFAGRAGGTRGAEEVGRAGRIVGRSGRPSLQAGVLGLGCPGLHPRPRALGVPNPPRHFFCGLDPCPLSSQNEEVLKKCAQEYLSRVKKEEQRYQALKVHAEEKLDR